MSLKNPSHCRFAKNLSESNLTFRFGSNSITSLALAMHLQISCLFYIKLFKNNKPATYKQGLQINDTMLKMFLAWFHVPVTATEWLWKRYGICKALSTSVTMTNRGHNFFYDIVAWSIRHHIISSNGTTQTTNTTRCEPSCVSSQCQNYGTY